ncbi:hypothetical protein BC2926_06110 [Bacillus cereus]|nr:hypothetical protein BC2926_06110 [Bacillus cereus]
MWSRNEMKWILTLKTRNEFTKRLLSGKIKGYNERTKIKGEIQNEFLTSNRD